MITLILTLDLWGTDDFSILLKFTEQGSSIAEIQTQNIHLQSTDTSPLRKGYYFERTLS